MVNRGLAFTLLSAFAFSMLGVATQIAYGAGATVGTLLTGRFLVSASLLWGLVALLRVRRPSARQVLTGLALGAGYAVHARLYSEALARLDAGVVDLLLFTYPAIVTLAVVALRRERLTRKRGLALVAATTGTTLVLAGGLGRLDPVGVGIAFAAAVAYSAYILVSAGQLRQTDPFVLAALVTTGAGVVLIGGSAAQGDISFGLGASRLAAVAAVGVIAVAGMATFLAGIERLGPARASIVSAVQPGLTPVLGLAVFSDRLGPAQILGAGLVIGAVAVLEAGRSELAWLPWLERRRLLRAAQRIEIAAGERVVRQGAHADAFYVIERGRADVRVDGLRVRELGPGEFFGELALVTGKPRTESVVASTALRVRVLGAREFERALHTLPAFGRAVARATEPARLASQPG